MIMQLICNPFPQSGCRKWSWNEELRTLSTVLRINPRGVPSDFLRERNPAREATRWCVASQNGPNVELHIYYFVFPLEVWLCDVDSLELVFFCR